MKMKGFKMLKWKLFRKMMDQNKLKKKKKFKMIIRDLT